MRSKRATISTLQYSDFMKKSVCLIVLNLQTILLKILRIHLPLAEDWIANIIKKNMTGYLKNCRTTTVINYLILLQLKNRLSREAKAIRQKERHL